MIQHHHPLPQLLYRLGFISGHPRTLAQAHLFCRENLSQRDCLLLFIHRKNAGTLGMVPLTINPLYTLYSGIYWVYPLLKGSLGGLNS